MGSRAHVFLDRPEQEDEQGLREAMCERRSVRICCHESPHDEATDPHVRPFHTVSLGTSVNKTKVLEKEWSFVQCRLPAPQATLAYDTTEQGEAHIPPARSTTGERGSTEMVKSAAKKVMFVGR